MPVAAMVAQTLQAPLDVVVVRKIGAPQNPEFAIGAVAEGGVHILSDQTVRAQGLSEGALQALIARADRELAERARRYRAIRPPISPCGRTAVIVDDGLATGRSALAAVRSLRQRDAARVVLAVPVAAPEAATALADEVDAVVCVETPAELRAVGNWYAEFGPTGEQEISELLAQSASQC
jgi:predicted phosphoribosyltransferase